MKTIHNFMILLLSLTLMLAVGCKKDKTEDPDPQPTQYATGWNGTDDPSKVPSSTNFGFVQDFVFQDFVSPIYLGLKC